MQAKDSHNIGEKSEKCRSRSLEPASSHLQSYIICIFFKPKAYIASIFQENYGIIAGLLRQSSNFKIKFENVAILEFFLYIFAKNQIIALIRTSVEKKIKIPIGTYFAFC